PVVEAAVAAVQPERPAVAGPHEHERLVRRRPLVEVPGLVARDPQLPLVAGERTLDRGALRVPEDEQPVLALLDDAAGDDPPGAPAPGLAQREAHGSTFPHFTGGSVRFACTWPRPTSSTPACGRARPAARRRCPSSSRSTTRRRRCSRSTSEPSPSSSKRGAASSSS